MDTQFSDVIEEQNANLSEFTTKLGKRAGKFSADIDAINKSRLKIIKNINDNILLFTGLQTRIQAILKKPTLKSHLGPIPTHPSALALYNERIKQYERANSRVKQIIQKLTSLRTELEANNPADDHSQLKQITNKIDAFGANSNVNTLEENINAQRGTMIPRGIGGPPGLIRRPGEKFSINEPEKILDTFLDKYDKLHTALLAEREAIEKEIDAARNDINRVAVEAESIIQSGNQL